jgi:hypothetical protein
MSNFNWGKFVTSFVGYTVSNITGGKDSTRIPNAQLQKLQNINLRQASFSANMVSISANGRPAQMQNFQMNNLEMLEKSLYFKNIMNLPQDLKEIVGYLQNNFSNAATKALQSEITNNNLINLNELAMLLQLNGKEAITKLISDMANASKQGINDVSQLKDLMKLINASVSTSSMDNSAQNLKALMLMYLPWLPLKEETDYELDVQCSKKKEEAGESYITVLISTKKFGNVKGVIAVDTGNKVSITITCSEKFPKDELKIRLETDAKHNSAITDITFSIQKANIEDKTETKAQILMQNNSKINQFLVIMAHSLIKHTIDIDKTA